MNCPTVYSGALWSIAQLSETGALCTVIKLQIMLNPDKIGAEVRNSYLY